MTPAKIKDQLMTFHDDEDGLEALQVVMIVAIAAVVLIALMVFGQSVMTWVKEKWEDLKGKEIS